MLAGVPAIIVLGALIALLVRQVGLPGAAVTSGVTGTQPAATAAGQTASTGPAAPSSRAPSSQAASSAAGAPVAAAAGSADEIHYTITGPTSVSFDWRGTAAQIRVGATSAYSAAVIAGGPVVVKGNGARVPITPNSGRGPFREARLTGLRPGTTYHYSIGGGPDQEFHTAPVAGTSGFTVAVEADIGNPLGFDDMQTIQDQIAAARPDVVLAPGDFDYANGKPTDGQIDALFGDRHLGASKNGIEAFSLKTPFEPAWGNHEVDHANDNGRCTGNNLANYKARFDFAHPEQDPVDSTYCNAGGGEDWHWFDYGNTRFIAYDEPWSDDWASWHQKIDPVMASAQSNPGIRFIVAFGHRPAYSSGYHSGEEKLASYTAALHAKYSKFVLVLNGHSHDYERTKPAQTGGLTYVTVGTGGGLLENGSCSNGWNAVNGSCDKPAWSAARWMRYGFLKLTFGASSIRGQFVCGPPGGGSVYDSCTQGAIVDSFTL